MIIKIQHIFLTFAFSITSIIASETYNIDTNLTKKIEEIKTLYSQSKYVEAIKESERILSINPGNEIITDLYMISHYKLGHYKEIINYYTETQAEYITSPFQLKIRAIAQAKDGNYYSSMLAIRSLKSLQPFNNDWKRFYHYIVYKNNPDSAYKELQRISKNTATVAADIVAADLYRLAGQSKMAVTCLETALTKDYLNQEALERLGDFYYSDKVMNKSIAAYNSILKINPAHTPAKLKMAKAQVANGQYLFALKVLDQDSNPQVSALREKISKQSSNLLSGESTRSIAQEEIATVVSTDANPKVITDEAFIPSDIDLYASEITKTESTLKNSDLVSDTVNKDKNIIEVSVSPKAKKYDLTGSGFTANLQYSNGFNGNARFTFIPAGRNWSSEFEMQHSQTSLKNLTGLTPSTVTLNESHAIISASFIKNNFSIGPSLKYEIISGTQTTPSIVRGNSDFLNFGIHANYQLNFNDHWQMQFNSSYFVKVISAAQTTSIGSAKSRNSIQASSKILYSPSNKLGYFLGFNYSEITTQYEGTQTRGTAAAKEVERDVAIPIGINYVF